MLWRPELTNYITPNCGQMGPLFPYYSTGDLGTTLPMGQALGLRWTLKGTLQDAGGNSFQIVKAGAGLTKGQLVALDAPTTGTVTSAGSTVAVINTNITASAVNSLAGQFAYFANLATTRLILANTTGANCSLTVAKTDYTIASKPNDANVLPSVPANGSAITITNPYSVRVCTATLLPVGVAVTDVTSAHYAIIQVAGLAEVLVDGTVAVTYGNPLAPGAAGIATAFAGTATALTGTAAPQFSQGASIVALHAWATASTQLVPCMVNMTGA